MPASTVCELDQYDGGGNKNVGQNQQRESRNAESDQECADCPDPMAVEHIEVRPQTDDLQPAHHHTHRQGCAVSRIPARTELVTIGGAVGELVRNPRYCANTVIGRVSR